MPLDDIASILRDPASTARVLDEHRARMAARLQETERIVADLRSLRPDDLHEVLVHERRQAAEPVVAVSTRTPYPGLRPFFDAAYPRLFAHVARCGGAVVGPPGASYGDGDGIDHDDLAVTAWLPVDAPLPGAGDIEAAELPDTRLAVALHVGPYGDMTATYGAIGRWVAEHDRAVTGPLQEMYLVGPPAADPTSWRTEVGWPVEETAR
jgi:effector-binding domain-containing protein